jgi:hypothetical protein
MLYPATRVHLRQLSLAGLRVELTQTKDPKHHTEVVTAGDFDMALGGWYAGNCPAVGTTAAGA